MLKENSRTPKNLVYVVKLGEQGKLTIELPQLANQYMLVEQSGNRLTIMPLDQADDLLDGAIALKGQQWTLLAPLGQDLPKA